MGSCSLDLVPLLAADRPSARTERCSRWRLPGLLATALNGHRLAAKLSVTACPARPAALSLTPLSGLRPAPLLLSAAQRSEVPCCLVTARSRPGEGAGAERRRLAVSGSGRSQATGLEAAAWRHTVHSLRSPLAPQV